MHTASEHAVRRIESASINEDPFPHILIDGIFPEPFYAELLKHLPPVSALTIPVHFGMMKIGDDDAAYRSMPDATRQFWATFDNEIKPPVCQALLKRYLPYAEKKLTQIFGEDTAKSRSAALVAEDFRPLRGIVQCRTTGDRMGPHVDKSTSMFTYLFYFAPDDSLKPFGTIFYDCDNPHELLSRYRANRGIRAWFPTEDDIAAMKLRPRPPVEFSRNRLVSYAGIPFALHGAASDAATPRYSMQSFCDLPLSVTLPLYEGWRDPISPSGIWRGDG